MASALSICPLAEQRGQTQARVQRDATGAPNRHIAAHMDLPPYIAGHGGNGLGF